MFFSKIDAMFAQHQRAEQQAAAKLQAKDAHIVELEQRLKEAVQAKATAAQHRGDEVTKLKDEVSRLTLGFKDEELKVRDWQQYANDRSARVAELERELKGKLAGVIGG